MSTDNSLKEELRQATRDAERMHRLYNLTSHVMFWLGIVAGLSAAVVSSMHVEKSPILGIITAIVTALGPLLVATRSKLDRGANWHKIRQLAAHGFWLELEHEGSLQADLSKRWRQFEEEHEMGWQTSGPRHVRVSVSPKNVETSIQLDDVSDLVKKTENIPMFGTSSKS